MVWLSSTLISIHHLTKCLALIADCFAYINTSFTTQAMPKGLIINHITQYQTMSSNSELSVQSIQIKIQFVLTFTTNMSTGTRNWISIIVGTTKKAINHSKCIRKSNSMSNNNSRSKNTNINSNSSTLSLCSHIVHMVVALLIQSFRKYNLLSMRWPQSITLTWKIFQPSCIVLAAVSLEPLAMAIGRRRYWALDTKALL